MGRNLTDGERDVMAEANRDAREAEEGIRRQEREMKDRIGKALAFAAMHRVMTDEEAEAAYIYVATMIDDVVDVAG